MATDEKWPPLDPGTRVKTTKSNTAEREWMSKEWVARKWGVLGTIIMHHDSHGLCYDVKHEDGSEGCYDPSEFLLVENQTDTFEDLLAALESYSDAKAEYNKAKEGCRDSYFLSREAEAMDLTKNELKEALDSYIRRVIAMKEVS